MQKAIQQKDEQINMWSTKVKIEDNQLNDKNNTISSLNNQLKANEQKIAELQNILQEIPKEPLDDNKKEDFFKAIENNNLNKVKGFLYAYKDVVNGRDKNNDKKTPFLFTAQMRNLKIAKLLKKWGVNINAKDKDRKDALNLVSDSETLTWLQII